MSRFALDPRLAADTVFVASLTHCELLVMNEARYPWAILVPRVAEGIIELHDLPDLAGTMAEVLEVSRRIAAWPDVAKVNIAALGNVVRQLHIHVVGRRDGDPAWPGPVWGHSPREPASSEQLAALRAHLTG